MNSLLSSFAKAVPSHIPAASTALELEAELKMKQKEYLELEVHSIHSYRLQPIQTYSFIVGKIKEGKRRE